MGVQYDTWPFTGLLLRNFSLQGFRGFRVLGGSGFRAAVEERRLMLSYYEYIVNLRFAHYSTFKKT